MRNAVRNFINIINEAVKPTKTRDKTNLDLDLMPQLDKGAVATAGKHDVAKALPGKKAKHGPKNFNVSAEVGDQMGRHFSHARHAGLDMTVDQDEVRRRTAEPIDFDDVGAEPVPPNPENLPALINRDVAHTNGRVSPEWHRLPDLPAMIYQGIKMLGRELFGQFTDTPIDDIQMIGTIGGLNPDRDVAGMMAWARENGVQEYSGEMEFPQLFPGYKAKVSLWSTEDYSLLLVKDFGGIYVYAWEGGRGVHLGGKNEPKRLTHEGNTMRQKSDEAQQKRLKKLAGLSDDQINTHDLPVADDWSDGVRGGKPNDVRRKHAKSSTEKAGDA